MSDSPTALDRARALLGRLGRLGRLGGQHSRRAPSYLVVLLVVLLGAFTWSLGYIAPSASGRRITLDELRSLVSQQRVTAARFLDEDSRLTGTAQAATSEAAVAPGIPSEAFEFWTSYPSSGAVTANLVESLETGGSRVEVDSQSSKQKVKTVTTFLLPLMILANLFALLLLGRSGSGGIGGVVEFGTMRRGRGRGERQASTATFADVAGCAEAVAELAEVRDYLRDPARYERFGAAPPRGVLLFGPPGCGKTLLARATAGEAGVPFFSVTGAEFVESLVGVGAARVRDLFARVRAMAPAIVFIDELDAAGRLRRAGGGVGGADEREQTLNQLLVEIDGFSPSDGIVVIGATNRPDIIDPALVRPGRFDRHVHVEPPDAAGRAAILALHARGRPIAREADVAGLARRTPGFTGADLANVVNEAALLALRERRSSIEQHHLDEAVSRVVHGPQRRGRVLLPGERDRLAVHEAGHALVACVTVGPDDVHRLSILTGGKRPAANALSEELDATLLTESRLRTRLSVALAGVAAEVLTLGEASTGSQDDIEEATTLARDIVARYGMSRSLGRARLLAADADLYVGDAPSPGWISPATHEQLDAEVRSLLVDAEAAATQVLSAHRSGLDLLVTRVLDAETIEGDELQDLLVAAMAANRHRTRPARPR